MTNYFLESADPKWGNHDAVKSRTVIQMPEFIVRPSFNRDEFASKCKLLWESTRPDQRAIMVKALGHAAFEVNDPSDYGPSPAQLANQILGREDRIGFDRVMLRELESTLKKVKEKTGYEPVFAYGPNEERFWPFAVAVNDPKVSKLWDAVRFMSGAPELPPDLRMHKDLSAYFKTGTIQAQEDWSRLMQCAEWESLESLWSMCGPYGLPITTWNARARVNGDWRGYPNHLCRMDRTQNHLPMYENADKALDEYEDELSRLGPSTFCHIRMQEEHAAKPKDNTAQLELIRRFKVRNVLIFVDAYNTPNWDGLTMLYDAIKRGN